MADAMVILVLIGVMLLAWVAYLAGRMDRNQDARARAVGIRMSEAASRVDEVRKTIAESAVSSDKKLDDLARSSEAIRKTGEAIHTLVNSPMSASLKATAVALRRIADLTKDPADVEVADLAELGSHEHERKQSIIDSGGKIALDETPTDPRIDHDP
jgi:hypothetical protein